MLKPGAPFFATTFLVGAMGTDSLPKAVRDRGHRFFTVDELEKLFLDAGFVDVVVRKEAPACAAHHVRRARHLRRRHDCGLRSARRRWQGVPFCDIRGADVGATCLRLLLTSGQPPSADAGNAYAPA